MINENQLRILENERKIMIDHVFLEKSDKPTSYFGKGITTGLLILTNKRLLFFSFGEGKSLKQLAPKEVAKAVVDFLPIVGDFISQSIDIIEKINEWRKERNIDFNILKQYAKMENSFSVSLEKISYSEKKGSQLLRGLLGMAYYKRRYLLIYLKNSIKTEGYCIYSVNPENSLDARDGINIGKWYKQINKQQKTILHDNLPNIVSR
jgi:hypothetical protein